MDVNVPAFQITGVRLSPRTTVEWPVVAFFDVAIAGMSIQRCRLLVVDGRMFVRGPAFDKKRNPSFGRVDFKGNTRRAITGAVVDLYESISGKQPIVDDSTRGGAGVIWLADAKRAAHG